MRLSARVMGHVVLDKEERFEWTDNRDYPFLVDQIGGTDLGGGYSVGGRAILKDGSESYTRRSGHCPIDKMPDQVRRFVLGAGDALVAADAAVANMKAREE